MQSVFAKVLGALIIAIAAAILLFYVGVALVYVALVGGALAILLLILVGIGGARAGRSGRPGT